MDQSHLSRVDVMHASGLVSFDAARLLLLLLSLLGLFVVIVVVAAFFGWQRILFVYTELRRKNWRKNIVRD